MLWLIINEASHQIISCNTHTTDKGVHQIWIERPNGKTMLIHESKNKEEVTEIKEAIDFAIKHGHKTLEIK